MRRFLLPLAALLCAAAAPDIPPEARTALESLRSLDIATAEIGYRLVTANAALCEDHVPASGMLLHGVEQYGGEYRAAAEALFGLGSAPGVAAVLPGSPAARAGVRAGDALVAIDGAALPAAGASGESGEFERIEQVLDTLDRALQAGAATLDIERAGKRLSVALTGAPACASRFQVEPSTKLNAAADGRYVQVSAGFIAYFADDDEFAAILAHELAHNILQHRARLDAQGVQRGLLGKFGKNAARIRETEIEADRLSLRLLANAGYKPEAAAAFWRRFGPKHDAGLLSDATHLRWKPRVALLETELAALRAQR